MTLLSLLLPLCAAAAADDALDGYLRYPDVHDKRVVFTAEDDLWIADTSASPSVARRLTRDEGSERHGKFSPDGKTIAFTADYDGNSEVFVVPAGGGEPRRLTWHPAQDEVVDWTPDGQIIMRSRRDSPHWDWELYLVDPDGSNLTGPAIRKLPLGWAARLSIDPDSGMYAFNRLARETRTWKRYRGGTAQDIWVGSPERADYRKLTDFTGTDAFPMWSGGRIWYVSDRGGTMNLWSVTPEGKLGRQHTTHDQWDIRWPSMGPRGNVVYMLAGGLRIYDTASGEERELQIQLPSDRDLTRRRNTSAEPYLTWASISPEGDRVLYVTRGEIFSVPVEEGVTLPVHPGSDARESWASFGPDGERVVYVTDESGEEAIVTADAWGRGEEEVVVPAGENGWHFPPLWSPDGDWIAWSDDNQDLYISAADGKETRKVAHAEQDEIREYTWSADGRWLAYTLIDRREFGTVYVYSVKDQTSTAVTGPNTHDHSPAWDPEGRYLYFLSDRFINPMMGGRDFQYIAHGASAELFALPLNAEAENPVLETAGAPPPDLTRREERKAAREEKKEEKEDKKREEKGEAKDVVIELEGIVGRAIKLPVEPGNYGTVAATADAVFFLSAPVRGMADGGWDEEGIPDSDLMKYDLEEKEADVFIEGVSGYELALGREHLMLMRAGQIAVVGTGGGSFEDDGVDLSGVVVALDPLEEWRQIYWEAWRHMRDFHWDQEMTGLDWEAIGARYAELLPRLSTRDDLRDVIGELIGELATSHTYVWGGDNPRRMSGSNIGLLGADLVREGAAWRVERIYRGDPADGVRSPLDIHGVDVAEGDYLLAINNQPFDPALPYTTSLLGLAGKPVLLTVSDTADGADPRQVVVTPMGTEWQLRYADWVRENREYVAAQTDGKIGYLHIPDMGGWGLIQFDRWFFPQLDKEGLVVDVRWNGGGFVSQMILERLRREVLHFDRSRGGGVWTYPYKSLNGPWVVLTNEHAGSDGDIFPASVQLEGLAPVIGMRSWGGVVGIRGDKQLTDGGGLTQPEYAFWLPGQGWALENRGVIPDIEVQNLPQELGRGEDAQLDRAIEEVLRLHEEEPPKVPEFGPAPDKSREAFKKELEE